ncbi:MAG TPA: YigZ family protein [Thermoanaerobaculia bacterium]|nr:YigZ family protein [Thermoanaerobaculia bacterium]HXT52768.1 YigZ family protein [Thermoanaerobaculia bacterium]
MASYLVPAASAQAELREKGSRFLALLEPATDEAAARARLAAIEAAHRDATHCCWAWRLGAPPRERSHDAGEPGGTAGAPILRALQTAELSDALLVVVRWFGGTKLGKGGLVRAYGAVAREAVAAALISRRLQRVRVTLEVSYPHLGVVQRLIHPPEVELVEESFGERVRLVLAVAEERLEAVRELAAALGLKIAEGVAIDAG